MSSIANDVTAVILSLGESTLAECEAALDAQTCVPAQRIHVLDEVMGFHAAFNSGADQVTTEFLLQVDADMILDPDCVEVLRGAMSPQSGASLGLLDDPVLGAIQGIKMFRTELVRRHALPPTLTTDTDRIARFREEGYRLTFAQRKSRAHGHAENVLGEHRPAYDDPAYLFGRFHRLGIKARQRSYREFDNYLDRLRRSSHPNAKLAIVALVVGATGTSTIEFHGPVERRPEFESFMEFAESESAADKSLASIRHEVPGSTQT